MRRTLILLFLALITPRPVDAQFQRLRDALGPGSTFEAERQSFHIDPEGRFRGATLTGNVRVTTSQYDITADAVRFIMILEKPDEPPGEAQYRLLAVGHIAFLYGHRQSFRAETLLYDGVAGRAILTNARLRVDQEFLRRAAKYQGGFRDVGRARALPPDAPARRIEPGRLVVAARTLTADNFEHFFGEEVHFTTCDFEVPHYSFRAGEVEAFPDPPRARQAPRPEGDPLDYRIEVRQPRIEFQQLPILPLPPLTWNTRWNQYVPLRRISYSDSRQYGNRIDTLWDGNIFLPRALRSHLDVGIEVDYMSKRGTGYGGELEYGVKPRRWGPETGTWGDHYGVLRGYAIDDRGVDRRFGLNTEPETSNRHRTRLFHRSRLPTGTFVDVEYAVESDRNFLDEYFESEFRGEKMPENTLYFRHYIGDSASATLLGKKRMVSYRSVVERIPEASFFLVEQPLGTSGFNLDLTARASSLRFRPDNALPVDDERGKRTDLLGQLAYVVGRSRFVKIRPFFTTRLTGYDEDLDGASRLRTSLEGGASLGMHLQRVFPGLLGYDRLRHTVDPTITYSNIFENTVGPNELFTFDETDTVDRIEKFTFGLRNFLFGARLSGSGPSARVQSRKLIETDLEIDYFPDPRRDNAGNSWGLLTGEALVYPHPRVGLFTDGRYDVEDETRFEEFNTGITLSTTQGSSLTLANRFRKHQAHSVTAAARWVASPKYELEFYVEQDLRRHDTVNQEYAVVRHFHRFSTVVTLEIDDGKDDVTFRIDFAPRELLSTIRDRRYE